MKNFVLRLFYFMVLWSLALLILLFVSNTIICSKTFKNGQTESNLLIMKDNAQYHFLVLGISHGRNFSRFNHHSLFEKNLEGTMINLAQGDALGGLENQRLYFDYFLKKRNRAHHLILVLSPTLMYSNQIDLSDIAFYREPLDRHFFLHVLENGGSNRYKQLFHYVKSKLGHHWYLQKPKEEKPKEAALTKLDSSAMQKGFAIAYPQGRSQLIFEDRAKVLGEILDLARQNNMKTTIVIPPALFGQWPGHETILKYLKNTYPDIAVLDHSKVLLQAGFYYDHHHLNTKGMESYLTILKNDLAVR